MRILVDFHHSSLLTSLVMLFQDRLGIDTYRPIGMEWFDEGYWAINDQADTAKQFLDLDAAKPKDGTPKLNKFVSHVRQDGEYYVLDPGGVKGHKACALDFFKNNTFDYVLASIPAHVDKYRELVEKYQPNAKLIIQMGNNWDIEKYAGMNVLASIAPQLTTANAMFYHQEFDLKIFSGQVNHPTKKISSYVNILQRSGQGWADFIELEKLLPDYDFKSYGGQCRDGNMDGPRELANSMHEDEFILHSKPGGDGFGHIIHNAYACGRPVIARPSQYKGMLAEQLLVPGTFIDLDHLGRTLAAQTIRSMSDDDLDVMSRRAFKRFKQVVNYEKEAEDIKAWLGNLN